MRRTLCTKGHGVTSTSSTTSRSASKRSFRNRGYTLIEVMMALGIMTAGGVGIMAMQGAATRGNVQAREMTTATQITRTWIERLRRDALLWNNPGIAGATVTGGPVYLSQVPAAGVSAWMTPSPAVGSSESYGFDYQGQDTATGAQMVYCTNYRLRFVTNNAIRVDVRTWWPRRGQGVGGIDSDRRRFQNCSRGAEAGVTAELATSTSILRAIYGTTLVRWQPLQ